MAKNDGWSKVAIPVQKPWDEADRPKGWVGACWGLVVHTTGGGLPGKARDLKEYPTKTAVDYYTKSHGTHYVCGWRGTDGDLLQVANEQEQANGVGVKKNDDLAHSQWHSVNQRNWEKDLPKHLVAKWHKRWDHTGAKNPLKLFPSSSANSCYIHVEMIPCVYYDNNVLQVDAPPMRVGLRHTRDQHDAIIALAIDVATRNGWAGEWWKTGRFVGHEDLTPISRSNAGGGWDPGIMRDKPFFDWDYVIAGIEAHYKVATVPVSPPETPTEAPAPSDKDLLPTDEAGLLALFRRFLEWVRKGEK